MKNVGQRATGQANPNADEIEQWELTHIQTYRLTPKHQVRKNRRWRGQTAKGKLLLRNIITLLQHRKVSFNHERFFNCWTAGITKKHRLTYERTYPVLLVLPNGSSIHIQYHEPLSIIRIPPDFSTLTEEERQLILLRRKPKTKVKIEEDIEDEFDEMKYVNLKLKSKK